jgi:DedD protein
MSFFKFRRGDATSAPAAGSSAHAQSVEVMRRRAKHRLIGASVLVLLGVVGFPLLFDTQPRPIAVDIPIEIPGKNSVKPLAVPAPAVAAAPKPAAPPAPAPAASPERVAAAASLSPKEEIYASKPAPALVEPAPPAIKKEAKPEPRRELKAEPKAEVKTEAKPVVKAEVKPEIKPEAKPDAKPVPKPAPAKDDSARAVALLNGTAAQAPKVAAAAKPVIPDEAQAAAAAETKGRMVVQVGAFADSAKADETRRKLEKAGLKTYTQVAETKDGKRIRVRVGPFASKAEAEKAVGKIRSLDLPVAILSF